MLVFTGTMFELAAAELLYPPGQPTMPVMILTLLGNFQTGIAMALTLMSIGVLALALLVAALSSGCSAFCSGSSGPPLRSG